MKTKLNKITLEEKIFLGEALPNQGLRIFTNSQLKGGMK